jgi:DNA-binding PadR family transcriptional regulator
MEEEPTDVMVLDAISQGAKKLDKIRKKTRIEGNKLDDLMKSLESKGLITNIERKGFFGPKKEIGLTDKGVKELEERRFEMQKNWDQMVTLWKSGDKEKLQQHIDNNRSILPTMMFMGIMDMMMFSSMMSFMGLAMTSFMPDQYMYDASSTDTGHDDGGHDMGHGDYGSGDFGHGDGGQGDMGGFDVNF